MSPPIQYQPEIVWPMILEAIAGGQSLSAVLRQPNMPSYAWATLQLRQNRELRQHYEEAVISRGELLGDEIIELADSRMPEGLDGPAASAWVQQLRIRVDARKWASSKLAPRQYGDKLTIDAPTRHVDIRALLELREQRLRQLDHHQTVTIESEPVAEKCTEPSRA
jgi:hypothetical protein